MNTQEKIFQAFNDPFLLFTLTMKTSATNVSNKHFFTVNIHIENTDL